MASRKTVGWLALAAGLVAWVIASAPREGSEPEPEPAPAPVEPPAPASPPPAPVARKSLRRRLATSFAFTVLFFAGGALAAGAGNELVASDAPAPAAETAVADTTLADTTVADTTVADVTTSTDVTTTDPVTTTDEATTTEPTETTDELTTTDPVEVEVTTSATPLAPPVETAAEPPATPAPPVPHAAAPAHRRVVRTTEPVPAAPPAPAVVSPFPVVAFDPQAWLSDNPGTAAGNAAVAMAEHYLGVPYRWGGSSPSTGFDCSGLTQYVYAQLGVWLPHDAAAQFLAYPRVDPSHLEPGDLVFFEPKADGPGHVAIYAGNGEIVEAPHTGATVRVGSLAGAAAALGFLGAVRPAAHAERALAALRPEHPSGTWFVAA